MLNNGQEAVKEIEQNKNYDMILMDINMPVMDGVDATKIIRKQYDKEQLPIIAISAVGFEDDILKMQNVGANGYLHKPFQLGELYSAFLMFGINSKNKMDTETLQIPNHTIDSNILNINKGVEQLNSDEKYKEFLQEVLLNLKEIEASVEKWITKRKYKKTKEFISYALKLAEAIGASSFEKILKEMEQLFIDQEEGRITEYVSLYNKEWQRLREEIERYLKISS
jgi:CheY-like chemotaxis protein